MFLRGDRMLIYPRYWLLALLSTVVFTHQLSAQSTIDSTVEGEVGVSEIGRTDNGEWFYEYSVSVAADSPIAPTIFRLTFDEPLYDFDLISGPSSWDTVLRHRYSLATKGDERLVINRSSQTDSGTTELEVCYWPTPPTRTDFFLGCGSGQTVEVTPAGSLPGSIPQISAQPTAEFPVGDGRELHLSVAQEISDAIEEYEQALAEDGWTVDHTNVRADLRWATLTDAITQGGSQRFGFVTEWGPGDGALTFNLTGFNRIGGGIRSGELPCSGEECELRGPAIEPVEMPDPEPLVGDCNVDGVVDANDLDCGCSTGIDIVRMAANIPDGDVDGDGVVSVRDFLALSRNFNQEGGYRDGDLNCDGFVTVRDFLTLSRNFGTSSASASSAAAVVPEPTSFVLSLALLFLAGVRRRRKRI